MEIDKDRYKRNILLPEVGEEGQKKLAESRVLVVGAGGLGSPVSLYLAAAGVGTIGIADFDRVDVSNLQRQILYREQDIGKAKAELAAEQLQSRNHSVQVEVYPEGITAENADGNPLDLTIVIMKDYRDDIISQEAAKSYTVSSGFYKVKYRISETYKGVEYSTTKTYLFVVD